MIVNTPQNTISPSKQQPPVPLDLIRLFSSRSLGLDQLRLSDNILLIPYKNGNFGVLETNLKGNTIRQLAYFDKASGKWLRNDGTSPYASVMAD